MKAIIGVVKNVDWKVCYIMYHTFLKIIHFFLNKAVSDIAISNLPIYN